MCGTVAGVIFYLGVASALPRSYYDYNGENEKKKVFSTSLYLTIAGAALQIGIGYLFKDYLSIKLFGSPEWGNAIFLMLCATALGFIFQLFLVLMRFIRWSALVSIIGISSLVLNIGLSYLLLVSYRLGVLAPIWGMLITNVLILLLTAFLCRRYIVSSIIKSEIKTQLLFGAPTIIISCATMVIEWADRFFINKFLTIQDAGIYSVGYKFASVITIFLVAPFVQIWNPMMMENRENNEFPAFFSRAITYYFAAGCVVLATASFFMSEVLYLVVPKNSYFEGLLISPIVMFGLLLNGFNNFVSAGLFFQRKIHQMMYVYCFMAALYVIVIYFAIPHFGYDGAAWGSSLIYGITPLFIYQLAKKYYAINFPMKKLVPLFFISFLIVIFSHKLEFFEIRQRLQIKVLLLAMIYTLIYQIALTKNERQAGKKALLKILGK